MHGMRNEYKILGGKTPGRRPSVRVGIEWILENSMWTGFERAQDKVQWQLFVNLAMNLLLQ
jgi:hypothetical protein